MYHHLFVSCFSLCIRCTTSLQSSCRSLQNSFIYNLQDSFRLEERVIINNLLHCPLPNICSMLLYVCNQKKGQLKYIPVSTSDAMVFSLQAECLLTARTPAVCWGCVAGLWSSSLLYNSRMRLTLCTCYATQI